MYIFFASEHGNPVHPGTKKVLTRLGIDTSAMFSTPITTQDFYEYDYKSNLSF